MTTSMVGRERGVLKAGGRIAMVCLALACTDTPTGSTTYTVGGTVSGLAGSGLVLRDNGGDDLALSANGPFTFVAALASGASYGVTILTQPTSPAQTCAVTDGSGTVSSANVTTVAIVCTTNAYAVGGTVSGLVGSGLVLRDNGGDDLAVSANGSFTFATALASGAEYRVTVFKQPASPAQTCTVTNGGGAVSNVDVTTVAIACVTNTYTVGGTVTGLAGSGLVLRNDGGDDLPVSANGSFTFAAPVASGATYSVTVFTHPDSPAQTCVVTGGSGTVATANVTNVAIACVTNAGMGAVRVTASTTGPDAPTTDTVVVDTDSPGYYTAVVPANGTVSFDLAPGTHTVSLTVTRNCFVTSPNPVPVAVASGATADIVFGVTCVKLNLRVTVTTTGPNAPETYGVRVTGDAFTYGSYSASIPGNGAVSLAVRPGDYDVRLVVPLNCTVTSPSIVGVNVGLGTTTNVGFSVTCFSAGTLRVSTSTTGPNAPATYTVGVYPYWGANLYSADIPSNGTVTIILSPGSHAVLLAVPPNCTVTSPNNVSATLTSGATTDLGFTVACQ